MTTIGFFLPLSKTGDLEFDSAIDIDALRANPSFSLNTTDPQRSSTPKTYNLSINPRERNNYHKKKKKKGSLDWKEKLEMLRGDSRVWKGSEDLD